MDARFANEPGRKPLLDLTTTTAIKQGAVCCSNTEFQAPYDPESGSFDYGTRISNSQYRFGQALVPEITERARKRPAS